jgi:hypothetical protein
VSFYSCAETSCNYFPEQRRVRVCIYIYLLALFYIFSFHGTVIMEILVVDLGVLSSNIALEERLGRNADHNNIQAAARGPLQPYITREAAGFKLETRNITCGHLKTHIIIFPLNSHHTAAAMASERARAPQREALLLSRFFMGINSKPLILL